MLNQSWHTRWGFARKSEPSSESTSDARPVPSLSRDALTSLLATSLIFLIRAYQRLVSPMLAPTCRFHPTCSSYSVEAIRKYGPFGGIIRALARLGRCHPFHEGGYDPVP